MLVTSRVSAPPSVSPHEKATIATVDAAGPSFDNLVDFDPMKKQESTDTIGPEVAAAGSHFRV